MAGSSLLALLDDIATVLDDVAVMSKIAARKTAGVLGDDLALNAEQVSGVQAARELPVVWAVAKGSLRNKLILVPAALLISALAPKLITPLLMLGGLYLCFEGFEKVFEKICEKLGEKGGEKMCHSAEKKAKAQQNLLAAVADVQVDMVEFERQKISGAIRTDFILSAEIIVISLRVVADSAFATQIAVVSLIALTMTIGVYGLVAGIVKMDDVGLAMIASGRKFRQFIGRGLLWIAPKMMKFLSVVGTAAMFLVGGEIIVHGIPILTEWLHYLPSESSAGGAWVAITYNGLVGVLAGGLAVAVVTPMLKLAGKLTRK